VGLASVKSIIETYHGRIWVESQVGKGSSFRFTIDKRHVPSHPGYSPGQSPQLAADDGQLLGAA
jgi:K+-sensing histidine kinase KdpD